MSYRNKLNELSGQTFQLDKNTTFGPSSSSISKAEYILNWISLFSPKLANICQIVPTVDDGLQFEWDNGHDFYLELELFEDKYLLYYVKEGLLAEEVETEYDNSNVALLAIAFFLGKMFHSKETV